MGTAEALGLGAATGVGDAETFAVAVGVGETTGAALTATPAPQTNLLPFFTHVYFIPAATVDCPTFLHAAPALTAADEPGATTSDRTKAEVTAAKVIFILKG